MSHTAIGDNRRPIRSSLTSPKLHLATFKPPTACYNKQSLGPLPLEQQTVAMTILAW